MRTLALASILLVSTLLAGCGGCGSDAAGADGGDGVDAPLPCGGACSADQVCRYETCVPTPTPCDSTDDCEGDSYCDTTAGECLPWGVGPGGASDAECTREVVSGVFFPDVGCEWLGPPEGDPYPDHKNVLGSPMVADFRGFGDPELGNASIVFISYNYTDGGTISCVGTENPAYYGVIRVIDGRSCEQQAIIATPRPIASTSVALGDLTGDGVPEIVAARVGGGLAAWQIQNDGTFAMLWETVSTFGEGQCNWGGPSIHDLDDDGVPEVLLYGGVFDASGEVVDLSLGIMGEGLYQGYIPVVADVDADGQPELVTGKGIYGWVTLTSSWELEQAFGADNAHVAVADLGTFGDNEADDDRATLDGVAEIVAVNAGVVTVYTTTGRIIFTRAIPEGGSGGPPTIADFDGDGRAEFAAAGGSAYSVFDLDCVGTPDPDTCPSLATDRVLWSQPSQDLSSNRTGSSVFDFEGDGAAEVVYADECFTRVYAGATGDVMYSRYRTSCTWYENPVIADTDADFGAEIIITSNTNCNISCPAVDPIFDGVRCFDESDCPGATQCRRNDASDPVGFCRCTLDEDCGGDGFVCLDPIAGPSAEGKVCRASHGGTATAHGIRVIGDQLGRWVATRPIWNQHAYAVTNVKDNGAIPRTSEWARNWNDPQLNNFRQNSPGAGAGAGIMPDLTARPGSITCNQGSATISVGVCNRGTEPVGSGVDVTVYDPAGTPLCTAQTTTILRPGNCTTVQCDVTPTPPSGTTLTATVDDDGTGSPLGSHAECREANNTTTFPISC